MVESTPSSKARRAPARVVFLFILTAAGAGVTASLILLGHPAWGGVAAMAGAAALIAETIAAQGGSPKASFASRIMDPVFDAALLAPIAWTMRSANSVASALALVALGCSLVAAYERVRGTSLGYSTRPGTPARGLRAAAVGLGLVSGLLVAALCLAAALAAASAAVAALNVAKQERGSERGAGLLGDGP